MRKDQFIHEFGNADGGVFLDMVGAVAVDAEFGRVGIYHINFCRLWCILQ